MSKIKLSEIFIKDRVKLALTEDLYPYGDITSNLLNNNKIIEAKIISNQKAVVAGLLFVKQSFKQVDKKIKLGICGEHGGDPKSIKFCSKAGLDYVSCSPYRVPIARLAAAQAELTKNKN